MSACFMDLPDEIVSFIDGMLPFEDSRALSQTCQRTLHASQGKMLYYDKIQMSDDASECVVSDSRHRRPPMSFLPKNSSRILGLTTNVEEMGILMKDIELTRALSGKERSPFSPGGYLGPLLSNNFHALRNLKNLSLHVDIMVETIKDQPIPCPVDDLSFAIQFLSHAPFNTFIQISACCAQYDERDEPSRNLLISGMQHTLKTAAQIGAHTEFVVEPSEGYVDMTIENGSVEYSFAFFYYNPSICEAAPPISDDEKMVVAVSA